MKKATAVLIFILILATFALTPSLAAGNIVITHQPQNGTFPENKSYYVKGGFSHLIHMTAAHLW